MGEKRYNLELTAEGSKEHEMRRFEPVLELQKNPETEAAEDICDESYQEVEHTPDASYQEVEHTLDESYQEVEHTIDESYIPVNCSQFQEPVSKEKESKTGKKGQKEKVLKCVTKTDELDPKPVKPLPADEPNRCICESGEAQEKNPDENPSETVCKRNLVTLSNQKNPDETRYLAEEEKEAETSMTSDSRKKKSGLFKWILLLLALIGFALFAKNQGASAAEMEMEKDAVSATEIQAEDAYIK